MEGKALSAAEVGQLADLDSREVLLAKLAGAMKGNLPRPPACSRRRPRRSPGSPQALQDKRAAEGTGEHRGGRRSGRVGRRRRPTPEPEATAPPHAGSRYS